jgi:uncharacterized membrane protein
LAGTPAGRIIEVDALRGIAIILMMAYHSVFDLSFLGLAAIDLQQGFWFFLPRAIGALFLLIAGASMALSESKDRQGAHEGYWHHAKRGLKLAAAAAAITLATWIYPHEGFIQFGIIHLIALATFIAPLFFRLGKLNVLLGLVIIAAGGIVDAAQTDSHYLFWLGITYPGYTALDHYPLIPWFGVVLIGLYAGQALFPDGKSRMGMKAPAADSPAARLLAFLGRHSLAIYLAHQVVLIGVLMAYKVIVGA